MNKRFFLLMFLVLASGLSACSSANALPATLTPTTSPTQTPMPQFHGLIGLPLFGWTPNATAEIAIPTLEQVRLGKEVLVDPETQKEVADLIAILEAAAAGKIIGAVAVESQWNGGTGNDLRLVTYGIDSHGNKRWAVNSDGTGFNEVPLLWNFDKNGQLKVTKGQQFLSIINSKEAVLIFTGIGNHQGFGEKPILVRDPISTSDGQAYYCMYFDLDSKTWQFIPEVLKTVLSKENQNYLVWQVENGEWLAGPAETEPARLVFDLDLKEWRTAIAPRPDFESMSNLDALNALYKYAILIESQMNFSPEELEALPFASAPPELIHRGEIYKDIGTIEWSAEALGEKEISVFDESGVPIGKMFVGMFGGVGDKPGDRKIFSALVGSILWGEKTFTQGGLNVGNRYNLAISYHEAVKLGLSGDNLNMWLDQFSIGFGPNAKYRNDFSAEQVLTILVSDIDLAKIESLGEFYRGVLPTNANTMIIPNNFR